MPELLGYIWNITLLRRKLIEAEAYFKYVVKGVSDNKYLSHLLYYAV